MINTVRHEEIFSAPAFGNRRIDVGGVGATGSKVALSLAKLGIPNIHVWDADSVCAENVAPQTYGPEDVGRPKVTALSDLVLRQAGCRVTAHNEFIDGSQRLGEIVFVETDTMSARRTIWEKCVKLKPSVRLLIETRMGTDQGYVYIINPVARNEIKGYEATLYSDEVAQQSPCGTTLSVGPTAGFIAELAVWQLIRWFAIENGGKDTLDQEILFTLRPLTVLAHKF